MSTHVDSHPLASSLEHLSLAGLNALADDPVRRLLARFVPLTHAHEIAVWAKDPALDQLIPILDTAGQAGEFEMKTAQPLKSGIVSRVYRENTSFLERGLWRSRERSPEVDQALHQVTQNEMCVPFYLAGRLMGVVSAVQLTDAKHAAPSRWGFDEADLALLTVAAESVSQAMERAWFAQRWADTHRTSTS